MNSLTEREIRNYRLFFFLLYLFPCITSCVGNEDNEVLDLVEEDYSGTSLIGFHIYIEGKNYYPLDTYGSDITIFVPSETDLSHVTSIYRTNSKSIFVDSVEVSRHQCVCDYQDYVNGVVFKLISDMGRVDCYTVRILPTKLPVVSVSTENRDSVKDKIEWKNAEIIIRNPDGSVDNLGKTGIRGRGNYTWTNYPKKPYALKFEKKQKVLGMPKHKRWVLLALYRGIIGNDMMFEMSRRASAIEWVPRGRFVEFVLNGKYQGLYYLCEQIKIDDNRVNISELKVTDLDYPEISGGFLLEYDTSYDEEFQFMSLGFDLPVMLKEPNDNVPFQQLNYIYNFTTVPLKWTNRSLK